MLVGAQFYTIRNSCKTLEDFSESLKKVADIGYKTVQISGTCEYEPQWLADQLKETGLKCVLTHIPAAKILADPTQVAKDHDVFDCDCVGLGWFAFNDEEPENSSKFFFDKFGKAAKELHGAGKYFMYHNHAHEFRKKDGKLILEHIAEGIPAEHMGLTLDTYWIQVGGGDPAYWIEKYAGRVPCIHLKDYSYGAKMAVVGEGNINFDRVFKAAEAAGTKYMLVEQDDCNGEDPFDCLRRSYEFLKANGFE